MADDLTNELEDVPVGTKVWIQDKEKAWARGELRSRDIGDSEGTYVFKIAREDTGEVVELKSHFTDITSSEELKLCNTFEDGGSLAEVWDLTNLTHLHEAAVLEALCERYEHNQIYTNTGPILLAVNPFKDLSDKLYKDSILEHYYTTGLLKSQNLEVNSLPPHIFATGDSAYRSLVDSGDQVSGKGKCNQSILVSGESGAGKTMSTKFIMRYLATVACEENSEESKHIADMVLESNPILEAFGNARTIRNDNSSRFGKFIEMQFNLKGKLVGARIKTYLLEKVRLARQAQNERNFHIFYELCKGASPEEMERWHLPKLDRCAMTNHSGCYDREDGVKDGLSYKRVRQAMVIMGFTDEETEQVMRIVSGVMNLSILKFKPRNGEDDSCLDLDDDETKNSLEYTEDLLMIDTSKLEKSLCFRKTQVGREIFENALRVEAAKDSRDALIKTIYSRLFNWIVRRVNQSIQNAEADLNFIGVLDIFGFEVFEHNSFEQLCINYANETLQQQFNQFVFKLEQIEYEKENIKWSFIDFPDNKECLELIDGKPIGILSLLGMLIAFLALCLKSLDDQCMYPQGNDEKLARQFYEKLADKPIFSASSKEKVNNMFSISHYAGRVLYDSTGFCEKNKDQLFQEALDLMQETKAVLLGELFPKGESASITASKSKALQAVTLGTQFKSQLAQLLDIIRSTSPHYVRCLKPNDKSVADEIVRVRLVDQLRYGGKKNILNQRESELAFIGVLEAVKVARAGYPVRMQLKSFARRYYYLLHGHTIADANPGGGRKLSQEIVTELNFQNEEHYQIGVTKMFLRKTVYERLEEKRSHLRRKYATKIQTCSRRFVRRKQFLLQRESAMVIQRAVRVAAAKLMLELLRQIKAITMIQKCARGMVHYLKYQQQMKVALFMQSSFRGLIARKSFEQMKQENAAVILVAYMRSWFDRTSYLQLRTRVIYLQCTIRVKFAKKQFKQLRAEAREVGNLQSKLKTLQEKVVSLQKELNEERELRIEEEEKRIELEAQVETLMSFNSANVLLSDDNEEPKDLQREMIALKDENKTLQNEIQRLKEELEFGIDGNKLSESFDEEPTKSNESSRSEIDFWKHQMNKMDDEDEQDRIRSNGEILGIDHVSYEQKYQELEEEIQQLQKERENQKQEIQKLRSLALDKTSIGREEYNSLSEQRNIELEEELYRVKKELESQKQANIDLQASNTQNDSIDIDEYRSLRALCVKQEEQINKLLKESGRDEEFEKLNILCKEQKETIDRLTAGDFKSEFANLENKLRESEIQCKQLNELKVFQAEEIQNLKDALARLENGKHTQHGTFSNPLSKEENVAEEVAELNGVLEIIAAENKKLKEDLVKEQEKCNGFLADRMEAENRAMEEESECNTLRNELIAIKNDLCTTKEARQTLEKKCQTLEQKMIAMETLAEQASGVKIALAKRLEELILENRSTNQTLATLKDKVTFYKDANKLLQDDLKETRRQLKHLAAVR